MKKWKELFNELLERQHLSRVPSATGLVGHSRSGPDGHFKYATEVDSERIHSEPSREVTEADYISLALAQMTYILESLENGDPRANKPIGVSDWKIDKLFKEWRQDVWWMFYQRDPYLEELFSLESICANLADAFRLTLTADGVRESCFRQGLCPPESKLVRRRCKRAKVVPLGATPACKKTLQGRHQERPNGGLSRTRRWGAWK